MILETREVEVGFKAVSGTGAGKVILMGSSGQQVGNVARVWGRGSVDADGLLWEPDDGVIDVSNRGVAFTAGGVEVFVPWSNIGQIVSN